MPRIRSLHPSFWTDDKVAELPPMGRLLFQGLWRYADDEGRLKDNPRQLKAEIFPYDRVSAEQIAKWIQRMVDLPLVQRYAINGTTYLQIIHFHRYQKPDKPSPSKLPPPPDSEKPISPNNRGVVGEDSPTGSEVLGYGVGKGEGRGEGIGNGIGNGEGVVVPPVVPLKGDAATTTAISLFIKYFGEKKTITEGLRNELQSLEDTYGIDWLQKAFAETVLQDDKKHTLAYARRILERWRDKEEREQRELRYLEEQNERMNRWRFLGTKLSDEARQALWDKGPDAVAAYLQEAGYSPDSVPQDGALEGPGPTGGRGPPAS